MTSSAPTTSATVVDHGFTDAQEYEEEYAYEERAPVPTPTNKIKAKPKSKKTALEKRPSTPPGHVQISAAPPKAGASPAQGHPSDEILQRTGTKIARKMTKGSPTPSQLTALREILVVPTLAQREAPYHRRKVGKVDYHVSKSRKIRYQNRRAPMRSGTNIFHAHNLKAKTMKDLFRMPGMRANLMNVRKKKPGYIPPSQPDLNGCDTCHGACSEGLYFVDAGDVDPCLCVGDCFAHCCRNADTAFYCTPDICRLDTLCSDAPRTHPGLRIYNTRRLGLGVYTTQKLCAGEIVAEYCGKMQEYEAMR
ncbi:hypothetical protein L914_21734 [Phytophthora nicotianae]|uniref:SET domain-containing protein n=1 Tax=Phytophthora nicotianae TaxID=4792 RepID=W2M514_PHYNI|nr:hypothetical protein L914_21734 [Phytophthora nicotianae]